MIDELADLLANFPGKANQTRCFLHIINLVAKSVIRQFDVAKGKADDALDKAEQELRTLAEGIDLEDLEVQREQEGDDDNVEGWVNERNAFSVADREELDVSVRPVKLVLVKVNKLRIRYYHSLLPDIDSCAKLHTRLYTPRRFCYLYGSRLLNG
jgi:hypothetical protein